MCLWHVRKAWAKNTIKKISIVAERSIVLQMVDYIMYGKWCDVDENPIYWALAQLDNISNSQPRVVTFKRYINDTWRAKTTMWCIRVRRIPHVGQNTNTAIES